MPSLLPPNATTTELALEAATERAADIPLDAIGGLWNPGTCRVDLLPWLAWAVGVPEWSSTWPEHVQREAIRATLFARRHAGTAGAIRRALAALDIGIELEEWYEHGGEPGTARALLALESFGIPEEDMGRLDRAINKTKRASAHLAVTIALTQRNARGLSVTPSTGEETTLYPPWGGRVDAVAPAALRSAWQLAERIEVTPPFPADYSVSGTWLRAASQATEILSVRPPRRFDESTNQFNQWYEGYTQ